MALHISADLLFEDRLSHRAGRRAFAARLDRSLKQNNMSSAQAARQIGVTTQDISYWRAGITAPGRIAYRQLSRLLSVDAFWLCLGFETERFAK